jgi:NAD(P)-dependent dehydrogenase (short-subunit alcohol dehydrogenase family)
MHEYVHIIVFRTSLVSCRQPAQATDLHALPNVKVARLDVADAASIANFAEEVAGLTSHVDVVVNNAGVYPRPRSEFENVTTEEMVCCGPDSIHAFIVHRGPVGFFVYTHRSGEPHSAYPNLASAVRSVKVAAFVTNTVGPLLVAQQLYNRGLLGGAAPSTVAQVTSKASCKSRAVYGLGQQEEGDAVGLPRFVSPFPLDCFPCLPELP